MIYYFPRLHKNTWRIPLIICRPPPWPPFLIARLWVMSLRRKALRPIVLAAQGAAQTGACAFHSVPLGAPLR